MHSDRIRRFDTPKWQGSLVSRAGRSRGSSRSLQWVRLSSSDQSSISVALKARHGCLSLYTTLQAGSNAKLTEGSSEDSRTTFFGLDGEVRAMAISSSSVRTSMF